MAANIENKVEKNTSNLVTVPGFDRLEFYRQALALLPDQADQHPGVAIFLFGSKDEPEVRMCNCLTKRKQTCRHILDLVDIYKSFLKNSNRATPMDAFQASIWYKLASILGDDGREAVETAIVENIALGQHHYLRAKGSDGRELVRYFSTGPDSISFQQRFQQGPAEVETLRGTLLDKLFLMTLTEYERTVIKSGLKTFRILLERSFWYRMAYHCFHEFGPDGLSLETGVDLHTGDFTVAGRRMGEDVLFRLVVPRDKVRSLITGLKDRCPHLPGLSIHPIPLKSLFKVSQTTELDLEVRTIIQVMQENGESQILENQDFDKFRYNNLIYLKDLGVIAELERSGGTPRRFQAPARMVLKKSQVPNFLEEFGEDLEGHGFVVSAEVKTLAILKTYDRIEISPSAMDRDWYWLDVKYGFGNHSLSLAEILRAKEEGHRYINTPAGWVDTQAEAFDTLIPPIPGARTNSGDLLKISRLDVFRLTTLSQVPVQVSGETEQSGLLRKFLDLKPIQDEILLPHMSSILRPYQALGLRWLLFLYENHLGGLLCDEMGLGKTHQAMALMACLGERDCSAGPRLVVCPTTVLSHWHDKLTKHSPDLRTGIFYGPQRDLSSVLLDTEVILTSYGILLNEIEKMKDIEWGLVIFDEIQNLKNPQTQVHEAAGQLKAEMKLGLTGTPIENRLEDLKALFDLVLPHYLGGDQEFRERYASANNGNLASKRRQELRRLISPFVLRRTKSAVLPELPEKIEDIRACLLSPDQVKLYRDATRSRGRELIDVLRAGKEPVPYIHIFSLLNLLKRICDHPALTNKRWEDYQRYESGKWELFKEVIGECLDSGQKVVVYSQFLDMIRIIEHYLHSIGVGLVTLTGQSRNRGEIVARFEEDPDCRVFIGSLKAGGVGIDLIAASIVIHYDRWWNAARENQATDRVHRIGQHRAVQVFKLITEGTLEEKIAAIIAKKENLLDEVIQADDPGFLKSCQKEELIDLLSFQKYSGR